MLTIGQGSVMAGQSLAGGLTQRWQQQALLEALAQLMQAGQGQNIMTASPQPAGFGGGKLPSTVPGRPGLQMRGTVAAPGMTENVVDQNALMNALLKLVATPGGTAPAQMFMGMQPKYDVFGSPSSGMGITKSRFRQEPEIKITNPPMVRPTADPGVREGFGQLSSSQAKADEWNRAYGTKLTATDFEQVQQYQPIIKSEPDQAGKLKDFVFWFDKKKRGWTKEEIGTAAPTADMRNKESARSLVQTSINAVKELGDRVVTESTGLEQRAKATGRTAASLVANDPTFIAYRDARMALAGNLAVAQQGSRPSDADIKAIWLPLVPDAFSDTRESAELKWDLIKRMSLPAGAIETPAGGTQTPVQDDPLGIFK